MRDSLTRVAPYHFFISKFCLSEIEAGNVGTVIVKDMSRFGRNYLEVGMYTEIALSRVDENELLQQIIENKTEEQQKAQAKSKQQLARQERRMGEINGIIKRLYEDNLAGKLTDERFAKLSGDYEREQAQLRASTAELRQIVEASQEQEANAKQFLKLTRSYIVPDELTAAMLHALVDKIIIHAPDKSTEQWDRPETWRAFLRRIHTVIEYLPDGSTIIKKKGGFPYDPNR